MHHCLFFLSQHMCFEFKQKYINKIIFEKVTSEFFAVKAATDAATDAGIEGILSPQPLRLVFVCSGDLRTLRSHRFGTCWRRDTLRNVLGFHARSAQSLAVETQIPASRVNSDAAWVGEALENTPGGKIKGPVQTKTLQADLQVIVPAAPQHAVTSPPCSNVTAREQCMVGRMYGQI